MEDERERGRKQTTKARTKDEMDALGDGVYDRGQDSSDPLQHDDRDLALGPLRVVVVGLPDRVREPPQPLALLARREARSGPERLVLDLQLDLRRLLDVLVPAGVLGRAAL